MVWYGKVGTEVERVIGDGGGEGDGRG